MNLASAETLESLSGLLEGDHGSICLTERGDITPVKRLAITYPCIDPFRHPNFRIFGCMNPPNDVGKRELPPGIRNRFTEFYVDELENPEDLGILVSLQLKNVVPRPPTTEIVTFYLRARELSNTVLSDGANQRPKFSLRTLTRMLEFSRMTVSMFGFARSLYEGACMSFLTLLDGNSVPIMKNLINEFFMKGLSEKTLKKAPACPGSDYVKFEQFWMKQGPENVVEDSKYIITHTIQEQLRNLCRVVLTGKYPVLLQGPTSSGITCF